MVSKQLKKKKVTQHKNSIKAMLEGDVAIARKVAGK